MWLETENSRIAEASIMGVNPNLMKYQRSGSDHIITYSEGYQVSKRGVVYKVNVTDLAVVNIDGTNIRFFQGVGFQDPKRDIFTIALKGRTGKGAYHHFSLEFMDILVKLQLTYVGSLEAYSHNTPSDN